jgi:hypothetical protein
LELPIPEFEEIVEGSLDKPLLSEFTTGFFEALLSVNEPKLLGLLSLTEVRF